MKFYKGTSYDVIDYMLDSDIAVNKFKIQSHYYVYFCANALGEKWEALYSNLLWVK